MAGSINKVILVGNLGDDPRVNTTQNGSKVVNLSVATTDTWKDKVSGERKDRTEWHRVVIFNNQLADVAERFLRKGSKVYIEGQLQTRSWDDANGQKRYTTEIVLQNYTGTLVMLDGRGEGASSGGDVFSASASTISHLIISITFFPGAIFPPVTSISCTVHSLLATPAKVSPNNSSFSGNTFVFPFLFSGCMLVTFTSSSFSDSSL